MDIERRIEKLEAQNRSLRARLRAVMLGAAAFFLIGASGGTPDMLQARRIQVVDREGRPIVVLGENDGHGFAALLDGLGNFKVQLNEQMAGGTLAIKNQRGHELVVLGYDAGGNGSVRTGAASGVPLAEVGSGEGSGSVVTYNSSGSEHVKLGTTHSGAGAVTTFAADSTRLFSITATTKGDGLIAAFDRSGRVRASWP